MATKDGDMADVSANVEQLLAFALKSGVIGVENVIWARNTLLGILGVATPCAVDALGVPCDRETPTAVLDPILTYCADAGLIPDGTATSRDLMDARLMGSIMGRPSEIIAQFRALRAESAQKATQWFHALNQAVHYIQADRIRKNQCWLAQTPYGDMEITVNLAKPEKSAEEIARATKGQADYPRCLLCAENEGFFGNAAHPARQNLRLIPLQLAGEPWFFQYSPYAYYNEHCIVLSECHTPMRVTRRTLERLLDFVDAFPHYFLGSNAGLPVVGGSILSHEHYQGGRHVFPLQKAQAYRQYRHPRQPEVAVSLIKWPMPVIRLAAKSRSGLTALAGDIMDTWQGYSDESAGIYACTSAPHNAVTPIARMNGGLYELDIIPRNNRTTGQFPLGVFHPHPALHHIKKENIGLIEVMGLAILPPRLQQGIDQITAMLTGERPVGAEDALAVHADWIADLVRRFGTDNTPADAARMIQEDIGRIFTRVLSDAGVFKDTPVGRAQFARFMAACGLEGGCPPE